MTEKIKKKRVRRAKEHYVNNKEFSQSVCDYVNKVNECKENSSELPKITNYIGDCFIRIAEGLARKPNFIGYSYRDDMVLDAIEDCVKRIMNFNIKATTRSGLPNAFAYFTQISFYAFLRRIAKEKKQQEIREKFIEARGAENFMSGSGTDDKHMSDIERGVVDNIKNKNDFYHEQNEIKPESEIEEVKPKKKNTNFKLSLFI